MAKIQTEPRFKIGWGETIQEIREYRGYSQGELAKKVGVTRATICKWEKEIMCPSIKLAVPLAHILKVDVETIFDI